MKIVGGHDRIGAGRDHDLLADEVLVIEPGATFAIGEDLSFRRPRLARSGHGRRLPLLVLADETAAIFATIRPGGDESEAPRAQVRRDRR